MDDVICITKKDEIDSKLDKIDGLHESLKFTVEKEENNCLPFLDMKIINDNGDLSSAWYTKPTATGLTLNYHSLAPFKYKKSVIIGFVYRIYRSCSSWFWIHRGLEKAKSILLDNQYPISLIESVFHDTLEKIITKNNDCVSEETEAKVLDDDDEFQSMDGEQDENEDNDGDEACLLNVQDKDKFNFFLNYRGKVTDKFASSVKRLNLPLRIVMTLKKTKDCMPNLKTPVVDMLKSNVVYKITCPQCQLCYVGQTARHLVTRYKEHVSPRGLLRKHFDECNVDPSFDAVSVLGKASNEKLLTLEALFIKEIKPQLNTRDEFRSRELRLKF